MSGKIASMNPEEMAEGGGLLDDANVRFGDCTFKSFDYNGTQSPVPAFFANLTNLDDGSEEEVYWSAGAAKDWEANEDGSHLISVGAAEKISKSSNFGHLMVSLLNAGFPGDKLTGKSTDLDGMEAHVIRIPAPKSRNTMASTPRADGREFDKTILTVDEVSLYPWDVEDKPAAKKGGKKGGKGTGKGAGKGAGKGKKEDGESVEDSASAFILEVLAEAGDDGVTKKELPKLAFDKMEAGPLRAKIVQLIFKDEFLSSGVWGYEGSVLKMG